MATPRLAAIKTVAAVSQSQHLDEALRQHCQSLDNTQRRFVHALCYGVIRDYYSLQQILQQLIKKPLKQKDHDIAILVMLGIYEIKSMQTPAHAAVSQCVATTAKLKKSWAKGLVNACLRNFIREQDALITAATENISAQYNHPLWMIERLQQDWPQHWQQILAANQQQAPLTIRVNPQHQSRAAYQKLLETQGIHSSITTHSDSGLVLQQAVGVDALPGFADGHVSVQDGAAQLSATLLDAQAGERVLDICAAPGGKTCHILEAQPKLKEMVAVDIDSARLDRTQQNLDRLRLRAHLIEGDARDPQAWWDGNLFDRILLDAPCTASGVIRRHPDIKLHRGETELQNITQIQAEILHRVWPLLKPGGMLLYATCSLFKIENVQQIQSLREKQQPFSEHLIDAGWGHPQQFGRQILPGEANMDGFFYARLQKRH